MKRIALSPRPDWQSRVEAAGLAFHSPEGQPEPYWNEAAAYEFTAAEIDTLEAAGNTMQGMCLAAAQHIIDRKRYAELGIPAAAIPVIEQAWNAEPPALYGRFDFSWAGESSGHPPKLLEYNADTPTALLEAAVIQWDWLKDLTPHLKHPAAGGDPDQFNSIHHKLIAKWRDLLPFLQQPLYFCGVDEPEDQLTLVYLRDTAQQAGHTTIQMFMEEIGWNDEAGAFLDPGDDSMHSIFKLYPWEAMLAEEFGPAALATYRNTRWIEPIWKMLLSNKGLLPILWELYPHHDLLLEAHFDQTATGPSPMPNFVRKPLLSREGANITIVRDGETVFQTEGAYPGPHILQALAPDAVFADAASRPRYPVLGLWMVDQECCGLGIRESPTPVTANLSQFLPHYFV